MCGGNWVSRDWHRSCLSQAVSVTRGGLVMVRGRILTPQIDSRSLMSEGVVMLAGLGEAFSDLLSGCPAIRADAEAYFLASAADSSAFSLDSVCAQFHLSTRALRGEVRRRPQARPLA